jgi:hypothetical protein
MGMSIDLAMNNLNGILTEVTEDKDSVCYVTEEDAETLQVAIDTMRKYQKIEQILDDCDLEAWEVLEKVKEVVEDGKA